jgi:hypothetical protein
MLEQYRNNADPIINRADPIILEAGLVIVGNDKSWLSWIATNGNPTMRISPTMIPNMIEVIFIL